MALPTIATADELVASPSASAPWKLERQKQARGTYHIASRGPRDGREAITLGYLADADADAALAGLNWLRAHGTPNGALPTPDRLLLHARDAARLYPDATAFGAKEQARDAILGVLLPVGRMLADAEVLIQAGGTEAAVLRDLLPEVIGGASVVRLDHANMLLSDYFETVWTPVRSGVVSAEKDFAVPAEGWKREKGLWTRMIVPALGSVRLRDLDNVRFDTFLRALTKQNGDDASGNTKRLVRAAYAACLNYAARTGHLGKDAANENRKPHAFYETKGGATKVYVQIPLDDDELVALLDAAGGPMHRALLAIGSLEGPRPSELVAIDWSDVDLEGFERVSILGARDAAGVRQTKTHASRASIPLLPDAARELRAWWEASSKPKRGPVFMWRGKPIKNFRTALKNAARRAELFEVRDGKVVEDEEGVPKVRRITPYTLRHTFATRARSGKVPIQDVASMLRHTSPRMVEKTYDHSVPDQSVDTARFPVLKGTATKG